MAEIPGMLASAMQDRIMTHGQFNRLLSSIRNLSASQLQQLRQRLDNESAEEDRYSGKESEKRFLGKRDSTEQRTKLARRQPKKKMLTEADVLQHMVEIGLVTELPDRAADFDDPDDKPIAIKGEPLSETVIRERR